MTPKDQLLASHDEFRKLAQEHTQYAQRLESLTQKRFLTEDEKLEEVRLKKLKLRLKDQMVFLERQGPQDSAEQSPASESGSRFRFLVPTELLGVAESAISAFFYCRKRNMKCS